jgi:hypothetical protein
MVKIQNFPQGTRVRVRRGDYPLESEMVGREGLVVTLQRRTGRQYLVQLDGEDQFRRFDESELVALAPGAPLQEAGAHHGGGGSDHQS